MNCSGLTGDLKIPDGVTIIGGSAFSNCGFTNIIIPNSVNKIGDHAFAYSGNLKTVTFNQEDPSIIKFGTNVFYYTKQLNAIYVPSEEAVTSYQDVANLSNWKLKIKVKPEEI